MEIIKNAKNAKKISCIICDFNCSKQSEWSRHILTRKHILAINGNILEIKESAKDNQCDICNKYYKTTSGLWKHKKKCKIINNTNSIIKNNNDNTNIINISNDDINNEKENEINKLTTIMLEMIKSNSGFQEKIIELCKTNNNTNNIITNNNNTMTNSNNKTFNLQVFLNEQCKDAMNLSDFMESIQLNLTDLENMDKLGYVECMFKNIFGHMDFISIFSRPFHCSDFKRGIIYIKENGIWEKEDMGHSRLINAIRTVEKKNFKLLKEWSEKYPRFSDYNSPHNDKYLKIYSETMSGDKHNLTKLIRKLSKSCVIDKSKT